MNKAISSNRRGHRALHIGCLLFASTLLLLFTACGSAQRRGADTRSTDAAETSGTTETATKSAATDTYPLDSLITLRGRVVLAHEVRAFTPEGDTTEYWIVDRSGALERAYDRVTGGQKNGKPALAKLKLRYKGHSDEGFAAQYEGVFEMEELISVEKAEE